MSEAALVSALVAFGVGALFTFAFLKQRKAVKDPLELERDARLEQMIKDLRDQLRDAQKDSVAVREHLVQATQVSEQLKASTEGLKKLLSNNKLRGDWGEQVAEDLMKAVGLVEKVNYLKQKSTESGRPDFTLLLPDGWKLNIDVKFPFDDLVAYQKAESDDDKARHLDNFKKAISVKVKSLSQKDYINPLANTLDFVVMFIPNEMIFGFICETYPDLVQDATKKKVVIAGPQNFTAMIRLVLQAHRVFRHEQGLQKILGLIGQFQEEYSKFSDRLLALGRQLETTQKTYAEVEGTRARQLTRVVDKIGEHTQETEQSKTPELVGAILDEEE